MKTEYITLKETILNNNCPECYATESLLLSFKQEKIFSKFMVKTKAAIIEKMNCKKCESEIFPGRWTDDIERVYNYHKKTIHPESSTIRFTSSFYILLLSIVLVVISVVYIYIEYPDFFQ